MKWVPIEIKVGSTVVVVTKSDIIVKKGNSAQLITQDKIISPNSVYTQIPLMMFNQLKKSGLIYTNSRVEKENANNYGENVTVYKLDTRAMELAGYPTVSFR